MRIRFAGLEIAGDDSTALAIKNFTPPTTEVRSNRTPRLHADGSLAGNDYLGESSWTFRLVTGGENLPEVLALSSALESAWKSPARRLSEVGSHLEYSNDGGRTWFTVRGRTGLYTGPTPDYIATEGYGLIDCEFIQTDPLHYASAESLTRLLVSPEAKGGLRAPVVIPWKTGRTGGIVSRFALNAGDMPAPARLTFHGPVQNPWVQLVGGWRFQLNGRLAWDEFVVVDARTRGVHLHSTTSPSIRPAYSLVSRNSVSFSALRIPAGQNSLSFSGVDETGKAAVDIAWHSAFTSMQHNTPDS